MKSNKIHPIERLNIAKMHERPRGDFYIHNIFKYFVELHGDRYYGDDLSIIGGIARLGNMNVTVIAQVKGNTLTENMERNFGMTHPEGYRKALRLMKQAERFNRPVICFVDTPGAFCGIGAEERGQGEAIANNLVEISLLKIPIISIIIGEGGSGGALALSVGDEVWMLENSVYSILSPKGFASILWKDASRENEAAKIMKITADDLYDFKIIEKIIPETNGGAHKNPKEVAKKIKEELILKLKELSSLDKEELLEKRYQKYRNIGEFEE